MPFRQSLRSAFLKFPCGHGGSQFASSREEPGLIPPSRIYRPPDVRSAPSPEVPRTRRTPGVHKDPSSFLGAGKEAPSTQKEKLVNKGTSGKIIDGRDFGVDGRDLDGRNYSGTRASDGKTENAKHLPTIDSEDDPPSLLRPPGHYDQIGDPRFDPDLNQPRDRYPRVFSVDNTSDYSNHSITHSLSTIPPIIPSPSPPGVSAEHSENTIPRNSTNTHITPQYPVIQAPIPGVERDTSSLNLGEESVAQPPVTPSGTKVICNEGFGPGPVKYSGMADYSKRFKQEKDGEDLGVHRTMIRENGKEDGHNHNHTGLCVEEIVQGMISKQQDIPATTSVETTPLEPVVHTRIQPLEHEEVTHVITRETHTTDIHPTIQPISHQTTLPQKHYLEPEPSSGKLVEIAPEQAANSGWDEVWRGDWVVGASDMSYRKGAEEVRVAKRDRSEMKSEDRADFYKARKGLDPLSEESHETNSALHEIHRGREVLVCGESPTGYVVGDSTDVGKGLKLEMLHMPGSFGDRNIMFTGPAN